MAEGFAWPPRQQVEPGTARPRQQPEVGSADIRFSENSGKPENSGTPIYGSRIRRQNPRQQVAVGTADPGNARQPIRKEPCGFAEINRPKNEHDKSRRGFSPAQTVKKLGRAREGRSPFELSIVPSGMYGGHGAIFSPENPIFQRKKRFLAGSAPEKSSIFSGDW